MRRVRPPPGCGPYVQVWVLVAFSSACGISLSGGLVTTSPDGGEADGATVPEDAAAADRAPANGFDATDGAGCPTGRGPNMIRVPASGAFCIDATEVSRTQYMPFVEAFAAGTTPQQSAECSGNTEVRPRDKTGTLYALEGDDPVDRIDYCDAELFCKWSGKRLCGRRDGSGTYIDERDARSATIAEWYAACSQDGAQASIPAAANLAGNAVTGADTDRQVGVSAPPAGGPTYATGLLHHIVGNVKEWSDGCAADVCVSRGGGAYNPNNAVDCTTREVYPRMAREADLGFRCCATPR